MLITFTTEHGNLVIRADDLRRIEDRPGFDTSNPDKSFSMVGWVEHDKVHHDIILGTAAENLARIVEQEAKVIAAYEAEQRKEAQQQRLAELQTKARTASKRGGR